MSSMSSHPFQDQKYSILVYELSGHLFLTTVCLHRTDILIRERITSNKFRDLGFSVALVGKVSSSLGLDEHWSIQSKHLHDKCSRLSCLDLTNI